MAIIKSTDETFDQLVKDNKIMIIDFWASWCKPCLMIAPSLEEISNEMSDQLSIAKHNIDEEPNTPTRFSVKGIPTMIMMKDGNHVSTKVGAVPKSEIISWIKDNI